MSKPNAVQVHELTKRFGDFTAVNRVTFHIPEGEIFGFLGPNGAGKTTVIRMLCGILRPTSGSGRVLGYDIARQQEALKPYIGYMSQKFALYDDLTVWENLDFYARLYGVPARKRRKRLRELVAMAGLTGRERVRTVTLSGAWKQRLALGCAIVHHPPMLFLDEPTAGVDPVSRREFWDMIYELAGQDVTVFVTTHYMDEAEHCNTIGLMHDGRLIAWADPDTLKDRMEGELLEIDCRPEMNAMPILLDLSEVREVVLHGRLLHATVADADRAIPHIKEALRKHNIIVSGTEPVVPSLEDVFVSMIETEAQERVRAEIE
jgi:ABC-2 type transport system ATP-binding protein